MNVGVWVARTEGLSFVGVWMDGGVKGALGAAGAEINLF